jgi:hypothetical protein
MLSILYHKKAFVLKIPLHPPLPKGDHKDYSHLGIEFFPTHFHDEPNKKPVSLKSKQALLFCIHYLRQHCNTAALFQIFPQ